MCPYKGEECIQERLLREGQTTAGCYCILKQNFEKKRASEIEETTERKYLAEKVVESL